MSQLKEYECFINAGIYGQDKPPDGHKKIRAHLVFDVNPLDPKKILGPGPGYQLSF
jgi:hypothetical protein